MRFFALIWLVLLFSCGIFKSKNKIISIDTTPRGAKVYYQIEGKEKKKSLGKAPLFQEVSNKEKGTYTFMYPDTNNEWKFSGIKEKYSKACGYIGKESISSFWEKRKSEGYGKKVLGSINPMESLIKGKRHECIDLVRVKVPHMKYLGELECKTYLVIPPKSGYPKFSHTMAKAWRDQVFAKNKKKCDKVILPAAAQSYMSFLGIDSLDPPKDLYEITYKNIFKLGEKFKATHLVFLSYKSKGDSQTVTPKIYDIHEGIIDPKTPSTVFKIDIKKKGLSNFLFRTFRFLPNGVAVQVNTLNRLWGENSDKVAISNIYDNFKFGITLDNIQFPQNQWMFNKMIAPVFTFGRWGRDIDMNVYGLTIDLKLFLHLPPGGVFVFRIGGGGAYINSTAEDYNYESSVWTYLADIGLEFYFFPWERIYLTVGYKVYAIDPAKVQVGGIQVTGESHVFFELGYFFPELRMLARKVL